MVRLVSSLIPLRKPDWLKVRPPGGENYARIKSLLHGLELHTVCEEAHCPNVGECWGGGTATIMILGDLCTRGCRFCAVTSGNPRGGLDPLEPWKVARALGELDLNYVVVTSVDRDDLPDQGAEHFARTIRCIKEECPDMLLEVLIPDFRGDVHCLESVVAAGPDVVAHNIETVRRLTPSVRDPRATYDQSLFVHSTLRALGARYTKSSIMLGLGERQDEVIQTMDDLRSRGVDILTLGQYLRPSDWHLEVTEYVPPEVFDHYRERGEERGFLYVAAGPLVRSSYRAGEYFLEKVIREGRDGNGRAASLATVG